MASNTPNLGLLKKDPVVDGNDTFNVQTMLNDNWDRVDEFAGGVLLDDTRSMLSLPADATPDAAFKLLADILGITYVFAGAGVTVTATKGGETKTALAASNGVATLRGLSFGEWTLSATISGSVKTKTVDIDTQGVRYISLASLDDVGWATLSEMGSSGLLKKFFSLGDTKDVSLTGIGTMTLQIADFDHDYLSASVDADKAPVTFLCKELLYTAYAMNSTNTNVGGFMSSALKTTLNGTIYNALPADLRAVIRTCYKWFGTGNSTTNGAWGGNKLWLPLNYEMFGSNGSAPATEQTTGNARQYPIFTDNASRIKKMSNGSGSATYYWLASPRASSSTHFCLVNSDGSAANSNASDSRGVCFGLCV